MVQIMSPSPEDGHTHDIVDIQPKPEKKKKVGDEDEVAEVKALFKEGMTIEADFRKKGEESDEFYVGKQWRKEDERKLKIENRTVLTMNEIAPKIDLLDGYHRQNRTDIKTQPVEDGDARIADILNSVIANILEQCNYGHEESGVFLNQIITGRGLFHLYIDPEDFRTPKIESLPWKDVVFGPHVKDDGTDAEYLCKHKWYSKAKVKQLWPDKADDVQREFEALSELGPKDAVHSTPTDYDLSSPGVSVQTGSDGTKSVDIEFANIARKEFRVVECWRKVYERVPVAVSAQDEFFGNLKGIDSALVNSVKTIPGLELVWQPVTKIRITRIAGGTMLSDERPDWLDDFMLIPVYALKRGDEVQGKVEAGKDPQREINKRFSLMVEYLVRMNSGLRYYDNETFSDKAEEERFKRRATTPGEMFKLRNLSKRPVREDESRLPQGLAEVEQLASEKLKEIMGIFPELTKPSESGVALMEKKRIGLMGNERLFDNVSIAKRRLGRLLVKMIQRYYTPDRIMRILETQSKRGAVKIGDKEYDPSMKQEIMDLLQNSDLTKYDVVVDESAHSPTQRGYIFMMLMELSKQGGPVPPEILYEYAPVPKDVKDKIIAAVQAMQQGQAQAEQAKQQTEIKKTIIAHAGGPEGSPASTPGAGPGPGGSPPPPPDGAPPGAMDPKILVEIEKIRASVLTALIKAGVIPEGLVGEVNTVVQAALPQASPRPAPARNINPPPALPGGPPAR